MSILCYFALLLSSSSPIVFPILFSSFDLTDLKISYLVSKGSEMIAVVHHEASRFTVDSLAV